MKSRSAILFLNVIVVCISLLTSIRVMPGPDLVGIALAFYVLLLLPGFLLNRLLSSTARHPLEVVVRVFSLGVVYVSVLVCLGFVPGIQYRGVVSAGAAITVALLVLDYVLRGRIEISPGPVAGWLNRRGEERGGRANVGAALILLLVFVACCVLFAGSGERGADTDALDHISFVRRSLDSGELLPGDSFHRDGDGVVFDPRKGIWHPVLALWAFQADAPVEVLWSYLPAALAFFALAAYAFFAWQLLGDLRLAIPACILVLLFFRGEGIDWFTKIGFSGNIVQVLLWCALAFLVGYYRRGSDRHLLLVFLLVLIGAAVHLVFVLLLAAFMLGMLIFTHLCPDGREWKRRFWLSVPVLLIAVALPVALRAVYTVTAFNEIHTHRQGMLLLGQHLAVVDLAEIASRAGTSFLFGVVIAPFVFWIAPQRRVRALVATLFLVPTVIVLLPYTATPLLRQFGYLYYRILYAAPAMCLLVIGLGGLLRVAFAPRRSGMTADRPEGSTELRRRGGLGGRMEPGDSSRVMIERGRSGRRVSKMDRLAAGAVGLLRRIIALAALAVFVLFPLRFGARSFTESVQRILAGTEWVSGPYEMLFTMLDQEIPRHSVIVSDPRTSYIVSAYTDHFVAVTLDQHCSPADRDALDRTRAVRDLFSPAVPLSVSTDWLRAEGADYILVNTRLSARADFFGTVTPEAFALTGAKFRSCPAMLREVSAPDGFLVFEVLEPDSGAVGGGVCEESFARPLPCRSTPGVVDTLRAIEPAEGSGEVTPMPAPGMDPTVEGRRVGAHPRGRRPFDDTIVLDRIHLGHGVYAAGDTLTGWVCWRVMRESPYGLPLEWTVRLDTDYPRGTFYRSWYSKLYRRRIERRGGILYRLTRTHRVMSGFTHPDQWKVGSTVRQDFALVLPHEMAPGIYRVKVAVRRTAFLANRTIRDYFTNEDSLDGVVVSDLTVVLPHARTPATARDGAAAGQVR